jgi:hypothetical protein
MIDRIYISDIQNELHYRDRRSARRWCRLNSVLLQTDIGSNKQFASKSTFENAKDRTCYNNPDAVNSTMQFITNYRKAKSKKGSDYKPQGEYEKTFLSILQSLSPKV